MSSGRTSATAAKHCAACMSSFPASPRSPPGVRAASLPLRRQSRPSASLPSSASDCGGVAACEGSVCHGSAGAAADGEALSGGANDNGGAVKSCCVWEGGGTSCCGSVLGTASPPMACACSSRVQSRDRAGPTCSPTRASLLSPSPSATSAAAPLGPAAAWLLWGAALEARND